MELLKLDFGGWAAIESIARCLHPQCEYLGRWQPLTTAEIADIAAAAQDRFEVHAGYIRARYGHSIPHVVAGVPRLPSERLLHATAGEHSESILRDGLLPGNRCVVHMTSDEAYSLQVATHFESPLFVLIRAEEARNGIEFLQAGRHVWLTRSAPARFIEFNPRSNPIPSSH